MFVAAFFPFPRVRHLAAAVCLLLAGAALLPAACAQLVSRTLSWQGTTRTWFEHVPAASDGSRAVPLVLVLHGNYSSGDQFAPLSEWIPKADAAGFIAVFPNGGVPAGENGWGWNAFVFDGSAPDDAGFLLALIQRLESDYRIDPARVYMVGFSNGGGMTSTFAGLHAGTLAAIAPVSGGWLTSFGIPTSAMKPDAPLPAWVWRGAKENFANGSLSLAEQDRQQTQFWAAFNQDNPTPQILVQPPDTTQLYAGGRAEVRFTSIADADHAYQPGTTGRLWDEFFSRFTRGAPASPIATPTPTPASSPNIPTLTIAADVPQAFEKHLAPGSFLVTRSGSDFSAALTVAYSVAGRAVSGSDYKPLKGALTIPAGSASARIRVRPLKDQARDGNKNVRVTLLPGNGYALGPQTAAKVQIVDRD